MSLPGLDANPPTAMHTIASTAPSCARIRLVSPAEMIADWPVATTVVRSSTVTASEPVSGIHTCSRSMTWAGPSVSAAMATRHAHSSVLPRLGVARLFIVAFGVSVTRGWSTNCTGAPKSSSFTC